MKENNSSALLKSVGMFAHCLAVLSNLLLFPQIVSHIRPDIHNYFRGSLPYEWALWGSWGFTVILAMCCFFGLSAIFQVLVRQIMRPRIARHSSGI